MGPAPTAGDSILTLRRAAMGRTQKTKSALLVSARVTTAHRRLVLLRLFWLTASGIRIPTGRVGGKSTAFSIGAESAWIESTAPIPK